MQLPKTKEACSSSPEVGTKTEFALLVHFPVIWQAGSTHLKWAGLSRHLYDATWESRYYRGAGQPMEGRSTTQESITEKVKKPKKIQL